MRMYGVGFSDVETEGLYSYFYNSFVYDLSSVSLSLSPLYLLSICRHERLLSYVPK